MAETFATHRLQAMAVFAHVVEAKSFTGAARRLGLSKSAVSKAVAGLEEHLGVRLLHRTTRRIGLTDAGEVFHASCMQILEVAERAEAEIGSLHGRPRGTIRVNAPIALGTRLVLPVALELMERHPEVEVALTLQDDYVDLVATGTDLAVRVGRLVDSSLVARKLGPARARLVASPDYLARRGRPRSPEDLAEHPFIIYTLVARPDRMVLTRGDERITVVLRGPLSCNNGDAIREAALAGAGVAMLPDFIGAHAVAEGRLIEVLADWELPSAAIYAVYAQAGPVTPTVRLFIDALATRAATAGCGAAPGSVG